MAYYLSKNVVFINSANRASGTSSKFTVDISGQIDVFNDYDYVTLTNFSCPKTYYLISSSNNTFVISENGTLRTITIPVGNYGASQLVTAINTALVGSLYTYVAVLDRTTAKITFTVSGNGGIQPIFNFTNSNIYDIIGFNKTSYTFAANTLTTPNVVNLQLTNTIYLMSDMVVTNNILAEIDSNVSDFSSIQYLAQSPEFTSRKLQKKDYKQVSFWLVNAVNGLDLDLNGLNFNFTFIMFKFNNYYNIMIAENKIRSYIDKLNSEYKSKTNGKSIEQGDSST